jgi:hypothetical protein
LSQNIRFKRKIRTLAPPLNHNRWEKPDVFRVARIKGFPTTSQTRQTDQALPKSASISGFSFFVVLTHG